MLRLLSLTLVLFACTTAGLRFAAHMKRRRDLLKAFCAALKRILLGVQYSDRTVASLLRDCGGNGRGPETEALRRMADGLDAGQTADRAWRMAAESTAGLSPLTEDDGHILLSFASMLGASCRKNQIEEGGMLLEALLQNLAEAESVYLQKGRVYRAMGVLLGVGVGILLL